MEVRRSWRKPPPQDITNACPIVTNQGVEQFSA
jgi:hypothetical protein